MTATQSYRQAEAHPTRALFTLSSKIQAWLDVEVALAQSQAELGMIPSSAAREIARKGQLRFIDEAALRADMGTTKAPIVSLVRFLSRACEADAGDYVHWGATTQNVMQTAQILLMRQSHGHLLDAMAGCLDALACQADTGASVVMAGRTQRRHALPITFGFKTAAWIDELLRHKERLQEAEPRVFTLIFGGAVGAMHSFDGQGEALNQQLARKLSLSNFDVPSRSVNDHMVEYVLLTGFLASTCAKIAQELYTLMSEEVGEVYEDLGDEVIGSSTMPQKVNPKLTVNVIGLATQLRTQVQLALDGSQVSHEGDAVSSKVLYAAIDTACPLAVELMENLEELIRCLRVVPQRMRSNLDLTSGLINSEHVMMTLARAGLGRQKAHDIVHEAALTASRTQRAISDILTQHPEVKPLVNRDTIEQALNPENHLGESVQLARRLADRARAGADTLRLHSLTLQQARPTP